MGKNEGDSVISVLYKEIWDTEGQDYFYSFIIINNNLNPCQILMKLYV